MFVWMLFCICVQPKDEVAYLKGIAFYKISRIAHAFKIFFYVFCICIFLIVRKNVVQIFQAVDLVHDAEEFLISHIADYRIDLLLKKDIYLPFIKGMCGDFCTDYCSVKAKLSKYSNSRLLR